MKENYLDVLAAPDVHGGVEGPDGEEVVSVDGERAADHGGRGEGRGRGLICKNTTRVSREFALQGNPSCCSQGCVDTKTQGWRVTELN